MKPCLLIAMLAACSKDTRPDERITAEYHELWRAHGPSLPRVPCPDVEAKRERLLPLGALYADAAKTWHQYDQPLPAPLGERLVALDPGPSPGRDLRCVSGDPSSKPVTFTAITLFGPLLLRKGELAVNAGQDAGWKWITESLRLYSDGPWQGYIWLFQPAWLLERATQLARAHAPPPAARTELVAAAHDAVMPLATLCAGFQDELLIQGGLGFYGHLTDLRGAFIEHEPELAELFKDETFAKRSLPSYETWQAFRALPDAAARCTSTTPAALHKQLEPLLVRLKAQDPAMAQLFEVTASRLETYDRMRAAEAAFVSLLGSGD